MAPRILNRALLFAGKYPRPFWALVGAGAVRSLGSGLFVPFWGLYLVQERGASGAQAGGLLALAGGMGLVGAPLGGMLADRIGRRKTLIIALSSTGIWLITYGFITNLTALAVLTLFALGSDLEGPATSAAIVDMVEPELRTEAFGLRRQASNIAFALGPPLGGLIVLGFSMRWLFVLGGIASLLYLAVVLVELPETRPERAEHEEKPRFRHAISDRTLLTLALGVGIGIAVYAQFDAVLGVFLHRDRGYALATWGLVFGINPLIVGLSQFVVARWAGRRSPRRMLALGAVLQGAALFALWPSSALPVLIGAVLVMTLGEMILDPVASSVAAALAPKHLRGSYEAVVDTAFAVSWAPGVLAGMWLVGRGSGVVMLIAALPLSVTAGLCFLRLRVPPAGARTLDVTPLTGPRPG